MFIRRFLSPYSSLSRNDILAYFESVFEALWYQVDGTSMLDMLGIHDPLTLSVDPGETYIPSTYAGTITAPDNADLIAADVNGTLYNAGVARNLSVSDFIDSDLERVPVKYDNASPHNIRMIGLFDPAVYDTLTDADKDKISRYMDLWVFYWGVWHDAGSVNKENRTF